MNKHLLSSHVTFLGVHSVHGHAFNLRSILLDTCGPEIRCGAMANDEKIELVEGSTLTLTTDVAFQTIGSVDRIYVNYPKIRQTVKRGDTILLDDGLIRLTVVDFLGSDIQCQVENTDMLGSRKGVNLPGLEVDLPILTEKDR